MNAFQCYECVLVTGASSGLGEEFAWQLAPRTRRLAMVARRGQVLDDLAASLRAEYPELEVEVFVADLMRAGECERVSAMLAQRGWNPDLLVNNAGLGDYGEFSSSEWPKIEAMLRVNIEALTRLTHLMLPAMIQHGRGAVVNVSSLASLLPIPDFAVYAATKAYVTSFSEALRIELREHGIRVLAVCPGPVHTGFGGVAQRGEGGRSMPGRESFYVPKEQVVAESLVALDRNCARVFPSIKTAAAALVISAIPIILLRMALSCRPRRS